MRAQHRSTSSMPWIFGRGGADRALICLAINGPLTVRELGRTTNIDSHKMWDIVERLRSGGLVVKRDRPGGRKYVALNRGSSTYPALLKLLKALDRRWPARRCQAFTARWRMPYDKALTNERLDHIFQSPLRSRTLLFVAAAGETDLSTIYELLGLSTRSASMAVDHWESRGVFKFRRFKAHRLISLNPSFVVAAELKSLLRAIIAATDEYHALRMAARRRLRRLLKLVGTTHQTTRRVNDLR